MTEPNARVPPPELGPGDVYVYAHANGAVFVLDADGRSRLAPLDEVISVAEGCHAAGSVVRAAWDAAPLAEGAVARLRDRGIPLDVVDGAPAPQVWNDGTDALMEAAAHGNDALLDDLIARGATVHDRDASGSTALHHAAANGNVHAIEVLVAAGSDPDARNARGFTPYRLATATRSVAAAQRLADLGADAGAGGTETVTFSRSHLGAVWVWLLLPVLNLVTAAILWVTVGPVAGLLAAVALLAVAIWIAPPRAFWTGGAPRRLDGTMLHIRGLRGDRRIDLTQVDAAAIGGSQGRQAAWGARWLLLHHAEGAPVDEATLRRLQIPEAERAAVAARFGRVLVVPLAGGDHEEVIAAVGDALSGLGADLSASLRVQLRQTRERRQP